MRCSTSCALPECCPSSWGLPRVWHLCSVVSVCSASLVKSLVSSLTALCVELLVRLFQAASFRCRARALSTSTLAIDAAVAGDHKSCASEAELAVMQVHEIPRHGHLHLLLHSPRHFLQLACLPLRACKCDQNGFVTPMDALSARSTVPYSCKSTRGCSGAVLTNELPLAETCHC